MSDKEFEEICKKFGISVKDGKIAHPLFDDVYRELKKEIEKHYSNTTPPLFTLLAKSVKPMEDKLPKFEWSTKEPTIKIGDWLFIGLNEESEEVWLNLKTRKHFVGSMN